MREILECIKSYQNIVLYRHVNPDSDAYGSQLGFFDILKSNFPNKNIYLDGDFSGDLIKNYLFDVNTGLPDFSGDVLGVVLDTANVERIDGDSYKKCKEIIKIDHHIVVDDFGDYKYVDPTSSSASQLVVTLLEELSLSIGINGASALYMGMVGDSNRFMYSSTDDRTFHAASVLLKQGIDINDIYNKMYLRKKDELAVERFILNQYHDLGNLAYYLLTQKDLEELKLTREKANNYVTLLSSVEEYQIWFGITENITANNYRVSIRSRDIPINDVANKFRGGGHAFAAGATLNSLDELDDLIACLKEKLNG